MRILTEKQHSKLDLLEKLYPDALVVGWKIEGPGPILWFQEQNVLKYVTSDGKMLTAS